MRRIRIIATYKQGIVFDITNILARENININDIEIERIGRKMVIIIDTDNNEKARRVLTDNGYIVKESDLITISLEDRPGELAKLSGLLLENGINIEGAHVVGRAAGKVFLAISVNDFQKALEILQGYIGLTI